MSVNKTNSTIVKSRHTNSKFGSGVKVTSEPVRFNDYNLARPEVCLPSKPPVACGSSNQVKINK